MSLSIKNNIIKIISFFYLFNAIVEVIAETFSYEPIIFITKPLIPILLMVLYFYTSKSNCKLFYVIMFFSLLTNLLFIPNTADSLFYGVITYTIHRIFLLILIFRIIKIKDYIPFFLATLPLGFIFFYLFAASDVPENSYYLIFFHNLIAAVLGGVAISSYVMNDSKQNSYLLISVLLFLGLQLVIYIEKYYMVDSHSYILRPLAMTLNILAFYMFYQFVVISEKNQTTIDLP
ncbi:hypothetical protein [Flavobacterium sp.]|uniref:hypothetical protein n=1 Tax=Flavobacterium sp. TaxID=239 RepID=UPI002612D70D|nr:hypothetical protein [Flavobacterium sp.]